MEFDNELKFCERTKLESTKSSPICSFNILFSSFPIYLLHKAWKPFIETISSNSFLFTLSRSQIDPLITISSIFSNI